MNMSLHLDSPYPQAKNALWLKGNLHTHTTRSDGKLPPQEMIRRYAELGYHYLAFCDHDVVSNYEGLDPCGMILIQGNEVSGGSPHVLDIGAKRVISANRTQQQIIDDIVSDGGFAVLCHPNWEGDFNHYPYEMMATLNNYLGVEIYNGGGYVSEGSHLALDKWDRLLATGRKIWGFANDDSHTIDHIGLGWNVVAVAERTASAVLQALRSGAFYASCGVTIERIETEGSRIRVSAPNALQIDVVGKFGRRYHIVKGNALDFDVSEVPDPFVRIECFGQPNEQAWTQPIYIRGGLYETEQGRLSRLNALQKSTLHAHHSVIPPKLLGDLSDPLWQKAEAHSKFMNLKDGTPAPVTTKVAAIISGENLYIGIRCQEPQADQIDASTDKALWVTDSVEIFLDTEGRGMSCWHIGINAGGLINAATRGATLGEAPQATGKAGRHDRGGDDRGWTAELVVPLKNVTVQKDTRWGFHICRNRRPVPGHFVWSWVGKTNHNREQYGSLIL